MVDQNVRRKSEDDHFLGSFWIVQTNAQNPSKICSQGPVDLRRVVLRRQFLLFCVAVPWLVKILKNQKLKDTGKNTLYQSQWLQIRDTILEYSTSLQHTNCCRFSYQTNQVYRFRSRISGLVHHNDWITTILIRKSRYPLFLSTTVWIFRVRIGRRFLVFNCQTGNVW